MRPKTAKLLITAAAALAWPGFAAAYVGPGAGISLLGALWGLIVAVVMAIGVILFWPIRIMLRKRKAERAAAEAEAAPDSSQPREPADGTAARDSSSAG